MKLVRLTDTRYILDAGPDIDMQQVEEIQKYWIDWWRKDTEVPTMIIIGGIVHPLEYEDRREPDIEGRLAFLENHVHMANTLDTTSHPLKGETHGEDQEG